MRRPLKKTIVVSLAAVGAAAAVLLGSLASSPAPEASAQIPCTPSPRFEFRGHTYQYICAFGISWFDAAEDADDRGGYLATITSSAEQNVIFDHLVGSGFYWIGLSRDTDPSCDPDDCLEWITGENYSYSAWVAGDPNDFLGSEDYVLFNWDHNGLWADHNSAGDGNAFGYILEIDPDEADAEDGNDEGGRFIGGGVFSGVDTAQRNRERANAAGAAAAAAAAAPPTTVPAVRPPSTGDGGLLP